MNPILKFPLGGLVRAIALGAAFAGPAAAANGAADVEFLRDLTFEQRPAVASIPSRPGDLSVSTWFDRADGTYAKGEGVRLFVRVNREAYVAVVNTGPSGKVALLFPNAAQRDHKVRGGETLEIPPSASGARISVSPPYGAELISVVVSDKPFELFAGTDLNQAGAFAAVNGGVGTFLARIRTVGQPNGERAIALIDRKIRTVETRAATTADASLGSMQTIGGDASADAGNGSTAIGTAGGGGATSGGSGAGAGTPGGAAGLTQLVAVGANAGGGASGGGGTAQGAGAPSVPLPKIDNPFAVRLELDKPTYRAGEEMVIQVTPSRTCYLTVYEVQSGGKAAMIFPNRFVAKTGVTADVPVRIAGGQAPAKVPARAPGPSRFVAVCSTDDAPVTAVERKPDDVFADVGTADTLARDLEKAASRDAGSTAIVQSSYALSN